MDVVLILKFSIKGKCLKILIQELWILLSEDDGAREPFKEKKLVCTIDVVLINLAVKFFAKRA